MSDNSRLEFIVIGGSVAGLASAIALRISGHNVLLLEREPQLGSPDLPNISRGCARIPPNAYKILAEWGLEDDLRKHAVVNAGFGVFKYLGEKVPTRDLLGINTWDPELLVEAQGDYMFLPHNVLIKMLHERATAPTPAETRGSENTSKEEGTVRVVLGAEVVAVDCEAESPSVTLRSGEVHNADAVIGADGASGLVRRLLMESEEVGPEEDEVTGMMVHSAMVPHELIAQDGTLDAFYDHPESTMWVGSGQGAMTDMNAHGKKDVHLFAYASDSADVQECPWTTPSSTKIGEILGECDPLLARLAKLAGPAARFHVKNYYELESWVSESGRVMAIGEAAHPTPPCGWHTYSIVLEDAVFLGKIFSRTNDPKRISELLGALDEHRRPRCEFLCRLDTDYIGVITMEDGPAQEGRDSMMRENHAAGRNVFQSGNMETLLDETRIVFGYDAADDADEWWMAWGRYHDMTTRG